MFVTYPKKYPVGGVAIIAGVLKLIPIFTKKIVKVGNLKLSIFTHIENVNGRSAPACWVAPEASVLKLNKGLVTCVYFLYYLHQTAVPLGMSSHQFYY